MKAIDWVDRAMKWPPGGSLASQYTEARPDPMFVEVLIVTFKRLMPWLAENGFALVPPRMGVPSTFAWIHPKDKVMVTIQEAWGKKVKTDFPEGWPQKISAVVTAGFVDLGSPAVERRVRKRRKNPSTHKGRYHEASTFREWMNQVNGILLKDIGLGSWQLTKQRYQEWFLEGMRPKTAANIVIDGVSTGQIKRRYTRNRA